MTKLSAKVALITGSTSGIGLATAHVLAKQGANIVLHGLLTKQDGERLAEEFKKAYQVEVFFSNADISCEQAIKTLMDSSLNALGSIDILVNNAGIQHTERLEQFPAQKWHDIIAINLSSAFFTMKHAIPAMQKQGWGRIVNIASVHGLVASINKSAYVAAKHGLVGLTKVAALENANYGITANAVCPGWVETPLINQQITAIAHEKDIDVALAKVDLITDKQPLPHMTQASQIGDLIAFLCSDSASTMTGASLPIDGAWTAQ